MSDEPELLGGLDDSEVPDAETTLEEELDDIELPEPETTIEEELDEIEVPDADGDLLDELSDSEIPDADGTADFEAYSGAFVPGIGDVYAAGGTFVVESIIGPSRGHSGMRRITTDRGQFAHPTALRVGERYRAVETDGMITIEQVTQSVGRQQGGGHR